MCLQSLCKFEYVENCCSYSLHNLGTLRYCSTVCDDRRDLIEHTEFAVNKACEITAAHV